MKVFCLYDELVPVSSLKEHPRNSNDHSEEQIAQLAKILEFQGWRYPIKVSKRTGFITSGHGRLYAAKKNGWDVVPVNFQDYETDDQENADVISDNSIASWAELNLAKINSQIGDFAPDFDINLLGIENFKLDAAEKLGLVDEDEVPKSAPPITVLGDLYRLGDHRLLCGDSTNIQHVERLMGGDKTELCFTSPPYSDQREYNGGKELSTESLAKFISSAFGLVRYFAVNLGMSRKNGEVNQYWDDYIKEARDCGLRLLSWNVWDKGECGSIGNQTAMFGISHEWIFVFGPEAKDLNRTVENKSAGYWANHNGNRQKDGSVKKGKDMRIGSHSQLKTVYQCPAQKARDDIDHPARFPVEFAEGYIEAMTDSRDGVYEPFGGSGSTLIACEKTNRKCFMMEIDPHYCDVIVERWTKFTGQEVYRVNEDGTESAWSELVKSDPSAIA